MVVLYIYPSHNTTLLIGWWYPDVQFQKLRWVFHLEVKRLKVLISIKYVNCTSFYCLYVWPWKSHCRRSFCPWSKIIILLQAWWYAISYGECMWSCDMIADAEIWLVLTVYQILNKGTDLYLSWQRYQIQTLPCLLCINSNSNIFFPLHFLLPLQLSVLTVSGPYMWFVHHIGCINCHYIVKFPLCMLSEGWALVVAAILLCSILGTHPHIWLV
jgi:hypothetical protein